MCTFLYWKFNFILYMWWLMIVSPTIVIEQQFWEIKTTIVFFFLIVEAAIPLLVYGIFCLFTVLSQAGSLWSLVLGIPIQEPVIHCLAHADQSHRVDNNCYIGICKGHLMSSSVVIFRQVKLNLKEYKSNYWNLYIFFSLRNCRPDFVERNICFVPTKP